MDRADRADLDQGWMLQDAMHRTETETGPLPCIVALCLECGKPIERIPLTDDAIQWRSVRRWCCAECRDDWEEENAEQNRSPYRRR